MTKTDVKEVRKKIIEKLKKQAETANNVKELKELILELLNLVR